MTIFTKTNRSILNNGTVDWEGNQSMNTKRITDAGEEIDNNDYVIRKTLDEHNHDTLYSDTNHSHGNRYAPATHTDPIPSSNHNPAQIGYLDFPDGLTLRWGQTEVILFQGRYGTGTYGNHWIWESEWVYFDIPFPTTCYTIKITPNHYPQGFAGGWDFVEIPVGTIKLEPSRFKYNFIRVAGNNDTALLDDRFFFRYMAWGA